MTKPCDLNHPRGEPEGTPRRAVSVQCVMATVGRKLVGGGQRVGATDASSRRFARIVETTGRILAASPGTEPTRAARKDLDDAAVNSLTKPARSSTGP